MGMSIKCYNVLVGHGDTVVITWDYQSSVTMSWWGRAKTGIHVNYNGVHLY